ncbi:MAG: COX15/CtaA family protein, partial [Gammaproteobacteria bacterium]
LVALGWLAWRLWAHPGTRATARWILALAAWQLITGVSNVVLEWPLLAAVSHTGGAAALVVVLTGVLAASRQSGHARVPFASSTVSRPA